MKRAFDIVQYGFAFGSVDAHGAIEIRRNLPPEIRSRLVAEKPAYAISVDSSDKESQPFLDELLKINTARNFTKMRYVEVPKAEIDRFPFYYIDPRAYDQGRHVSFEANHPTCNHSEAFSCPWGFERTSPVRIHPKAVPSLGIGRISAFWELGVELLVSADVKRLFEEHEITGLVYEPCEVGTQHRKEDGFGSVAYVASIQPRVYSTADHIQFGDSYCPVHGIITLAHCAFNERISRALMGSEDFQMIDSIHVREKKYQLQTPQWVVSSHLVKLLLENKVKGLQVRTYMLKEKFWPLVNLE